MVKKKTASKSSRFFALVYGPGLFFVTSRESVRMSVSYRPLSRPSFQIVASAVDTESCS